MPLQRFIDALEDFSASRGIAVFRTPLSPWVVGRMDRHQIVLRQGMSKQQELLTLVHELTHFLAHLSAAPVDRTICEYEAEAVEKLVACRLGLNVAGAEIDHDTVTDDLLACSVARVRWVTRTLLDRLQT
jgi:hypothetical protein